MITHRIRLVHSVGDVDDREREQVVAAEDAQLVAVVDLVAERLLLLVHRLEVQADVGHFRFSVQIGGLFGQFEQVRRRSSITELVELI